jgi:putative glutamine amidotransferase
VSSPPTNVSDSSNAGKPVVGITSYDAEEVTWGAWTEATIMVPAAYVRAIERAGGRPLLLPPSADGAEQILDLVDGIIFSGGSDVAPEHYGAEPHPETDDVRPKRDQFELELLQAALERDMPVLAVCRGSQVLNVARGGDLVQHLPEIVGHHDHKHTPGEFADHDVTLEDESRVGALLGDRAPVKSHHHQGFGRIGEGLRESGWAEDGTVEALEDPTKRFAVGVLWHPEEGEDMALFEGLVAEARRYREERPK